MLLIEVLMIAVALAMDAFAVSLAVGTTAHARGFRPTFRLAFHFGLFQALMPIIGWFLGSYMAQAIHHIDHWLAFGLLCYVGGRMVKEGWSPEETHYEQDPTRKWALMLLCIATSIDALVIGLSLGMMNVSVWYPSAVIGVVTAGLSWLGIQLGNRIGQRFGQRMEIVGGVLLCLIGLKVLIQGMM